MSNSNSVIANVFDGSSIKYINRCTNDQLASVKIIITSSTVAKKLGKKLYKVMISIYCAILNPLNLAISFTYLTFILIIAVYTSILNFSLFKRSVRS